MWFYSLVKGNGTDHTKAVRLTLEDQQLKIKNRQRRVACRLIIYITLAFLFSQQLNAQKEVEEKIIDEGEFLSSPQPPLYFYQGKKGESIHLIFQMAGGFSQFRPGKENEAQVAPLNSTFAILRFGFWGTIPQWNSGQETSFRLEMERNIGNEPSGIGLVNQGGITGTGVSTGTASLTFRDTYIKHLIGGFSFQVGIITDPASVDYYSLHVADLLLTDLPTGNTIAYSGYNRSQGVRAEYSFFKRPSRQELALSFMYTAGNPLTTTLSIPVQGDLNSGALAVPNLYAPSLRTISSTGTPDSNIEIVSYSPSLTYSFDLSDLFSFGLRGTAQFLSADVDRDAEDDLPIRSRTFRGGAEFVFWKRVVRLFGNFTDQSNDQYLKIAQVDFTKYADEKYSSTVTSVGFDFNYGRFVSLDPRNGIGFNYSRLLQENYSGGESLTIEHINIGTTYWLGQRVSMGARYAISSWDQDIPGEEGNQISARSYYLSLRLLI